MEFDYPWSANINITNCKNVQMTSLEKLLPRWISFRNLETPKNRFIQTIFGNFSPIGRFSVALTMDAHGNIRIRTGTQLITSLN